MKQIKTIIMRRDYMEAFDAAVNQALQGGWTLVRRYIDPGFYGATAKIVLYNALVAELEREV